MSISGFETKFFFWDYPISYKNGNYSWRRVYKKYSYSFLNSQTVNGFSK
jgi:hypothetical protein